MGWGRRRADGAVVGALAGGVGLGLGSSELVLSSRIAGQVSAANCSSAALLAVLGSIVASSATVEPEMPMEARWRHRVLRPVECPRS